MWFILIIGLLSPFVNCNDKPILQELFTTKNLAENQTIRIICPLIQGESVEFKWYKDDEKLTESNKRKIYHHDSSSSELMIKSLSIDDLGDYRCISKNKYGEDVQKISLYFNVKPKWTKEPQDMMSSLSKDIELECRSNGYPLPINKWIKLSNNKMKIEKEFQPSSIIKFELRKETSGYYKCISTNSQGSIEKIINVGYYGLLSPFISCDDKPILQELWVPKNLAENQTIRLMCGIIKGESVQFEWYKNDEKLKESNKRKIKYGEDSSELIIKSLSIDDLGDYKCVSHNKYGEDVQSVPVYFNVKPKWINEPKDLVSTLFKEIKLECNTIGYPLPINRWIKLSNDKKTIVKEFQPSSIIKFELTKETSGYYKCISTNSQGSIEKTINVGYYAIDEFINFYHLIIGKKGKL